MNTLKVLEKDENKISWASKLLKKKPEQEEKEEKDSKTSSQVHFSVWKVLENQIIRDGDELSLM